MFAPEHTRGLVRGAVVAFIFLVVFPALLVFGARVTPHPGMHDWIPMSGLLVMLLYGPLFPFLWAWDLSVIARLVLTGLEIVVLMCVFAWLTRRLRLRAQVLYAAIGFGATVVLATLLIGAFS